MVQAVAYLRISQDRDGTMEAPDRQRTAIQALCADHGWELVGEYLDASISASSYSRKARAEYIKMTQAIGSGTFDTVVVWDTDRLTRKPREIEDWIDWTTAKRVKLVSVLEQIDTSTEAGRLYLRMKGNVAAHESEHKSTRIKARNVAEIAKGRPVSGPRPFGWENDRITLRESEAVWL